MRKFAIVVLVLGIVLPTSACGHHRLVHHNRVHASARAAVHHGKVVVIKKGHVHSAHCGHYHHMGKWFLRGGHVHKHGCGHVFKAGLWILAH